MLKSKKGYVSTLIAATSDSNKGCTTHGYVVILDGLWMPANRIEREKDGGLRQGDLEPEPRSNPQALANLTHKLNPPP